jgi:hypothetical protein
VPGFVELADEESERVWHGLTCLPVKGGTWTRRTNREAPRPRARVQSCVLIITYIVSTDSIITTPPPPLPCIRRSLSFVLESWPPTYESDRQTDISTFFDSRSQLYPYTKTLPRQCSGNNFIGYCPPAKQRQCSTAYVHVRLARANFYWMKHVLLLGGLQ